MKCRFEIAAIFLLGSGIAAADRLELVRHINLWDGSPIRSSDTAGLTYHPPSGHLLIVDSEISEYGEKSAPNGEQVFAGHNVFEASLDLKIRHDAYFAPADSGSRTKPVGIAYNPIDGHVYISDDDRKRIFRFRFDIGNRFGPPVAVTRTTLNELYTDPEGIACDLKTGLLYVASGSKHERVLRFQFDLDSDAFVKLGEFPVKEHIRDPEGIGVDPVTGNVFLVSTGGIAEFQTNGVFVQLFDFEFFQDPNIASTLPGGLTFAPSSDANDHPDICSIYISHRGIDNGRFTEQNTLDGAISEIRLVREPRITHPVRVPADYSTIQAAIDAASYNDTIVVSPGTYRESLVLSEKDLTLVSEHFLAGDASVIDKTVIDGGGAPYAVQITKSVGHGATISGFTIQNADDGITASAPFTVTHCHVTNNTDGIDYEGGGGLVSYSRFTRNRDDGIDLDGPTSATIEFCDIEDNGDDGIEIRLHPYSGPPLKIHVRNNTIARNGEDGIQLIDYDTVSDRKFLVEGNVITGNAMAGIGCMAGSNTTEDYSGAPIAEQILVFNNTFVGNNHHLTGGANLLAVNNVFVRAKAVAIKKTTGQSRFFQSLFWGNAIRQLDSDLDLGDSFLVDPLLDADYRLLAGSPAIDVGFARAVWQGRSMQVVPHAEYQGDAPDLGASEHP